MLKLLVVVGSTRPGRGGLAVGKWFQSVVENEEGFEVSLADLAEFNLPLLDEPDHPAKQNYTKPHTQRWSEVVAKADAFVFVSPEYDYFPNAALVNAIQFLSREWADKVAGVVSYGGVSGGLRATQALRLLLSGVGLQTVAPSVPLMNYSQSIDGNGVFNPGEHALHAAQGMLKAIHKLASKS